MHTPANPRRRWRRTALATAGISLIAAVSPMIGANPAAAVNAPLVTTDGVGIRVDENAILGPALELIENEIQPFANQMIYNGALANSPAGTPKALYVTSNVELGFDFINAGTTGFPQGGLSVHADILGIEIRYVKDPVWPFADCSIYVRPDTATIDASAKINAALLPNAPIQLNPITAYWDDDPSVTSTGVCWTYLIDDFFDTLFTSGGTTSIADTIEAELNGQAQDLINDLWADHVTPVVNSLNEFGITFNQLRTDTNGLIVTANVNAAGPTGTGIILPGLGGPFNVANTPDSGATSSVNTLLARRTEVTVTIHPNVVAQFLNALNQKLTGEWGVYFTSGTIETVLLPSTLRPTYDDAGWTIQFQVTSPPSVTPTGTGGKPLVNLPAIALHVYNTSWGPFEPVASFTGTLTGLDLKTVVRTGSTNWGPAITATTATLSNLVRTYTNGQALSPTAAQMQPFVRTAWDLGSNDLFTTFVSLPPLSIGGLAVSLCTTCTRFAGDQRYTEYFNIA